MSELVSECEGVTERVMDRGRESQRDKERE